MKKLNLNDVKEFVQKHGPNTRVYVGGDSERYIQNNVWYADFTLAVVVHIDGNSGCKIFGEVQKERDFDQSKNKPRMRLMTEVYKIAELYLKLQEMLPEIEIQVHLDINPNEMYGSSCVINEAIGYIRGTCNVVPFVKPEAFAASYAADRLKYVLKVA